MTHEFLTPEDMRHAVAGQWLNEAVSSRVAPAGVAIDSREDLHAQCFIAIIGARTDGHLWLASAVEGGAAMLIVQADRRDAVDDAVAGSIPILLVADTRTALWQLGVAWRARLNAVVVGITGSAGKTTTRRLVQSICERHLEDLPAGAADGGCTASVKSYNNDIGVPLTILRARSNDRFLVLEIGTNAPGEIAALSLLAEPDIVVITNAGRAHLEGLGSLEGVAREKASILEGLSDDGLVVLPAASGPLQDEVLARLGANQTIQDFGESRGDLVLTSRRTIDSSGAQTVQCSDGFEARMHLPGAHNAQNALAAILVARALEIEETQIGLGLAELASDPMRFSGELIGDSGIMIYNDAYNANPDAVLAALTTFGELSSEASRRVLILGDMMELGDDATTLHAEIGRAVVELSRTIELSYVIFIGPLSSHGARAVLDAGADLMVVQLAALTDVLCEGVAGMIHSGDSVLIKGSRSQALERVVDSIRTVTGTLNSPDPQSV